VKGKSHRSISMDGVLHKVPYGKKVSDAIINEVLPRSASATYDGDGQKPYIAIASESHVNKGIWCSRSLTESLESYSRILDSIASSESKRTLTSSNSSQQNVMSSFPRTSNSEFRSQSLKGHDETPEDSLESHDSDAEKTNYHRHKEVGKDGRPSGEITGGLENLSLPEEISDKKCDVAATEAHSCTDPSPSEVADTFVDQERICDDNDQVYSATKVGLCDAHSTQEVDLHAEICDNGEINSSMQSDSCKTALKEVTIAEEHMTHSHDNQMHSFQNSKQIEGTFCVPDLCHEFEAEISCEQETASPMSVLDTSFSDDLASPMKHAMLDGEIYI
jgi:hypothetical protein